MYILLTHPRYTSCNSHQHSCTRANYRNNVCLAVCVPVSGLVWEKASRSSNNAGDDDNDLQLHVFFTISRTTLDFGAAWHIDSHEHERAIEVKWEGPTKGYPLLFDIIKNIFNAFQLYFLSKTF